MELLIGKIKVAIAIIYSNTLYSAGHRVLSICFSVTCGMEPVKVANLAWKSSCVSDMRCIC